MNKMTEKAEKINQLLEISLGEITSDQIKEFLNVDLQYREILAVEILAKASFLLQDTSLKQLIDPIVIELVKKVQQEELMMSANQELIDDDEALAELQKEIMQSGQWDK